MTESAGAAAAAAVVDSADELWRAYVAQVRERLAASHGGDEMDDGLSRRVAEAAGDIDAARLQVTASLGADAAAAARAQRQAVERARAAADHLLGSSRRYALDAADPVAGRWLDVQASARRAGRLLDALG